MLHVLCPRLFLTAILAYFCVHQTIQAGCPSGWKNFGDSCYKLLEEKLSWDEASSVCDRPGGSLVVPINMEENNFTHEIQKEIKCESKCALWIGCKHDGGNLTCTGQTHAPSFSHGFNEENHNGQCVIMSKGAGGKWRKKNCTEEKYVVCAIPKKIRTYCLTMDPRGFGKQKCLHGHEIKSITVNGVIECGAACWAEPRCRSFNLWQGGPSNKNCQLNNATILESDEGDHDNAHCYHFEL